MTAQRIINKNALKDQPTAIEEAIEFLSTKTTLRRLIWICEICGMTHLGTAPRACDSCGVNHALVLQQDTRSEMHNRW